MAELASRVLGATCAVALIVLPGAWIAAGLRLRGLALWMRLATACLLSPLVAYAQFYVVRWCGMSFGTSAYALVVLNLPALALLWRRAREPAEPDFATWRRAWPWLAACVAFLVVPAVYKRVEFPYWMHSWQHSGTIYLLAGGELVPEESRLAGIAQGYPWAAHLFQGLIGRVLDLPPAITYLATNVLWVLIITCFVGEYAARMGASIRGRVLSWVALWFAVNIVGYVMRQWVVGWEWESKHAPGGSMFGDPRFTPWLWKFQFMEHIVFGLGALAPLPAFVDRAGRPHGRGDVVAVASLLACTGIVYPVLSPAGFALVAGAAAFGLARRTGSDGWIASSRVFGLALALLVAGLATYAHLELLTSARHYGTGGPSSLHDALAKALQVTISTSVLLAALALAWRRSVGATPRIRQNLAAGALASLGLYCVAHIPSPSTEYKFVFAAAVMLAPFAGVAAEPWLQRAGRAWPLVVGACLIFGSLPYVHRQSSSLDWNAGEPWPVDVSHFPLRFEPSVRGASVLDAIREASPRDAVIAADAPLYDVTALTWRPLYAPENHHWIVPGVYIDAEYVLTKVRGYSRELVGQRRATCAALFHGDDAARESAHATIARLARPIVVLGDERDPDHAALIAWLAGAGRGRELARDDGLVAWLVDARP